MEGKRRGDGIKPSSAKPGDYWRAPFGPDGELEWIVCCPNGKVGSIRKHEVTEHEDGTITVSPSILLDWPHLTAPERWHGYLERGVWREV